MKKWGYLLIALGVLLLLADPVKQAWLIYGY